MISTKRIRAGGLFAFFLAAAWTGSWAPVCAQSLDSHISELANAVKEGDSNKALTSLEGATHRLGELYAQANKLAKPASDLAGAITKGLNAFSGEPLELAPLVDKINKDTEQIDAVKPSAPEFGSPLRGVSEADLKSADPTVRGLALDRVRAQGREMKESYLQELRALKARRDKAMTLATEAEAADRRGYALEKTLDEIDSSAAGVFLNIGGEHLAYMLLDVTLEVRPALAGRLTAARDLVKRYDDVIAPAEKVLSRYEAFNDWATFYRWQDWARENYKASPPSAFQASDNLKKAQTLTDEAHQRAHQTEGNEPASRNESLIRQLTEQTIADTNATREKADALLRQAAAEDGFAAALREFGALTSLAGAIHGASQPSPRTGRAMPPIIIKNTIIFKLVPPPAVSATRPCCLETR